MQSINPVIKNKRVVECPVCQEHEFTIEHLFGDLQGRECCWSCDQCSTRFSFLVKDDVFTMEKIAPDHMRSLVLLQSLVDPKLHVVTKGFTRLADTGDKPPYEETADNKRYYYEEHTCPTNFMRGVERIIYDGDFDPHGIFKYVRHVDIDVAEAMTGYKIWDDDFLNFGFPIVFPELVNE